MQVKDGQWVEESISSQKSFPPPPGDALSLIPLGGMGEIGKNLNLVEYGGDLLVIDCGVKFPNEAEYPGIDLIIPEMAYLSENRGKICGLVLTHGHEDHIGGLPFLLRRMPLDIYGTRYTLGLVHSKLEEHKLLDKAHLVEVRSGTRLKLGCFEVECFTVAHSIVDGLGLAIRTPAGLVVHSGDFKFDPDPVDGFKTDEAALTRLGQEGVLALLSDSTNVDRPGFTRGEREVRPALEEIFAKTRRRIITTSFASNVQRFQQIVEVAHQFGRQVATLGMSMNYNMRLAEEMGYLRCPPGTWVDFSDLRGRAPDKTVVVTTGSQGEPMSGLARMAAGTHSDLKVEEGDVLIYSARAIPGNERTVATVINNFYRHGADVYTEGQARVHVSGHGSRDDLRRLLQMLKPRYFLPAHGEVRHQVMHRELAAEAGIRPENVFLMENGDRWVYDRAGARKHGKVAAGEVLVDGKDLGDTGDVVLRDRKHLSEDGIVLCMLSVSKENREILAGPDIIGRGLAFEGESEAILEEAKERVRNAIAGYGGSYAPDWAEVRALVTQVLKKFFKQRMESRPIILPVVMEL